MMAGVLFAQGVDGIDVDTTPPPPPPSARGRQPSTSAQYAEVDAGWGRLTRTRWTHWLSIALFVLIVAASAVLCIYDNEHIQAGLHGDEAESGIEARNLNSGRYNTLLGVGWYDQPLPSFLVQAVGLRLFGNTVSGLRTTSAVVSLLTLPLVFLLARKLFGTRVAFLTLTLMAFAHWFIAYAHIGINYNQTTLLEVLAMLAFWHGWQTKQRRWFVVSGVVTGVGLYVYFASRVVPILLLTFAGILWLWQRRNAIAGLASRCAQPALQVQSVAIWASAMILVFAPMGVFFLNHAKEFGSRADFVFLFSDTQLYSRDQKLLLYTGTTDIPAALSVQVYRYGVLFNVGGDRSGQYGNQLPLLEYLSGALCVLGLALALRHARQPRFMLLLVWIVLTVIIGHFRLG
ncbi:MAG: glycosyltransferase family 39 protein [Chloroflexi bacterium]|nr:MAG: glycosyltransferase family 39 protein [Chloroflexota bacterium]